MKSAGAVLVLAIGGCTINMRPNDAELRTGMTQEEMDAAPGHHETKAALVTDVRKWRMLDQRLDEGRAACAAISWKDRAPICVRCNEGMEAYSVKRDLDDQPYRVEETAYYCRKESQYYYHYVGGKKRLDVWLGPYALDRKRVKPDAE